MATGILIANGTASVTYTYTPQTDARVLITNGTSGSGYVSINGVPMYLSLMNTSGGWSGTTQEMFVGAGQTVTFTWPSTNQASCVISCIEE